MLSKELGEQAGNDAPQVKVVSAKDQHPVLNGVGEEITAKTNQENHYDTVDEGSDDAASDAAIRIGDNRGSTSVQSDGNRRKYIKSL